jgi:hypothetical protein
MFSHPSIHLELSRQRQQAILGERERDRIAKVVMADARPPASPARRPQRTSALRWRRLIHPV